MSTSTVLHPDRRWWRAKTGLGVLAGSPGTFLRVSEAGAPVLDAVEAGRRVERTTLTARLVATGAAHPEPGSPLAAGDITAVVPVFARSAADVEQVQRLVSMLAPIRVVVVDDASPMQVDVACHRLVRRDTNGGPGAARNSGLAAVDTPVVVFVDSDVEIPGSSVLALSGHLADPAVSMVAPRVRSQEGTSIVAQYEALRSPLDMGTRPASVRPGSHVPYVPTAVLLVRTDTARARFDEGIRWGEDVEFVWRSVSAGALCLYDPSVTCTHEPRRGIRAVVAQRFAYGRSAAVIDSRIPWSVAPVRANLFLVAPLALVLARQTLWAATALLVALAWTDFALRGMGLTSRQRLDVARHSLASASGSLARAVCREWWPLFAAVGAFVPVVAFVLLLPLSALLLIDTARSRPSNQVTFLLMRLLDWGAYGLGVWAGALRQRSVRCLLPRLSVRRSARGG